jgi:hypothetical protein
VDPDDAMDVDDWFAARGLRLDVHEVDVTGMERIRPGTEEPPKYELTLIGLGGHINRHGYASGDNLAEAKVRARDRYLQEQSIPPSAALRWSEPVLNMITGDGSWEPSVDLVNLTDNTITVSGPMMARALLLRPDGSQVTSRQQQPWPMPAVLKVHRLSPNGSTAIPIALSLLSDEKAALPPGRYRLTDVWWGDLTAPGVDVEIRADQ